MIKKLVLLILCFLAAAPITLYLTKVIAPAQAEITVTNLSGQDLTRLDVYLCDSTEVQSHLLKNGEVDTFVFNIKGECGYKIFATLKDGKELKLQDGYTHSGSNYRDSATIHPTDIKYENLSLESKYSTIKLLTVLGSFLVIWLALYITAKVLFIRRR